MLDPEIVAKANRQAAVALAEFTQAMSLRFAVASVWPRRHLRSVPNDGAGQTPIPSDPARFGKCDL